ncbi:MAG: hypothetical protein Q8R15_04005 [Candidatus Micrarchaeota archaeon]|nr:hypothetical protein [Candidatus Micrarchaeota archaeon]
MPRKPSREVEERPIVGQIVPQPPAVRPLVIKRRHLPEQVRKAIDCLPKLKKEADKLPISGSWPVAFGRLRLNFIHEVNELEHQPAVREAADAISRHGLFGVRPLPKYAEKIATAIGKTHFIIYRDKKGNIIIS